MAQPAATPAAAKPAAAAPNYNPGTEKTKLVKKLEALNKNNPDARVKWWSFCKVHAEGNLSPTAQDLAFLETFFDAYENGDIVEEPGCPFKVAAKGSNDAAGKKMFVGGLPRGTTEQDIRALFEPLGAISKIDIKMDDMGNSRGFGFVFFEEAEVAEFITTTNKDANIIHGKWIDCKLTEKMDSEQKPKQPMGFLTGSGLLTGKGGEPASHKINESAKGSGPYGGGKGGKGGSWGGDSWGGGGGGGSWGGGGNSWGGDSWSDGGKGGKGKDGKDGGKGYGKDAGKGGKDGAKGGKDGGKGKDGFGKAGGKDGGKGGKKGGDSWGGGGGGDSWGGGGGGGW
eukprot:TRINITY_DN28_c2_g1_i1.p1 TRINITY_DN28_c2_g1~~TRINITY_DN28_c2_g1_i1.p1  ORF type:complete len:340 (+),score=109.13 TRINITY_DN28_c2_g1_i1:90-1109(+)